MNWFDKLKYCLAYGVAIAICIVGITYCFTEDYIMFLLCSGVGGIWFILSEIIKNG